MAHLDPAPDGGEECGGVDNGDGVNRLGIVGGREFGSLLEVMTERPHRAKGDAAEVDNRHRSCDWRRR